ncbi:MAG TPA: hypothetical protein VK163_06250 [Opitutaceae bacterium]|nr:hypothetical protein [Opitutaceae bacterium]
MFDRTSRLAFAAGALLLGAAPIARAVPESLLRNSPFLPAGNAAPVTVAQNGRLELRGIVSLDGKPRFTVFDTSTNRAVWLAVGESDGGLRVAAYDASAEAITVEFEGQSVRLTMKEAQIVSVAVSLPTTGGGPAQPGAAVNPAPPANEQEIQERRNKIIEELRRRRAMRQAQAAQPPNTPPPRQ